MSDYPRPLKVRYSYRIHANKDFGLLCCATDEYSPRFPIALPILYTSSKATSVGMKPIAMNIAASPKFIMYY